MFWGADWKSVEMKIKVWNGWNVCINEVKIARYYYNFYIIFWMTSQAGKITFGNNAATSYSIK